MTTQQQLQITNVSKVFNNTPIFDQLSMNIDPGEIVVIMGPNGCGKTTLMECIAGIQDYSGNIKTSDQKMSYVSQNPDDLLLPWLNIVGNITFPDKGYPTSQLLQTTGLHKYAKYYPYQLSGGYKQMLLIARALFSQSKLLILDEPFKALDHHNAHRMRTTLLDLWKEHQPTIVMVSHDIDEAIFLAKRILVLSEKPTTIVDEIHIPFKYPRDSNIIVTSDFLKYKRRVQDALS
jgi:ABC-type nitrate/sulfonate/bicarbonate transport system ATPase subunit